MDMVLGPQFHGSPLPPSEFMKAPAIHVGTKKAAGYERVSTPDAYKLHFSEHAVFHDEDLSDEEANAAHSRFLAVRKLPVPPSVSTSAMFTDEDDLPDTEDLSREERAIRSAVTALGENKILRYKNMIEDYGSTSYVVPSPWLNMRQPGKKDPQKQSVLPMDYSGAVESETTKHSKLPRSSSTPPVAKLGMYFLGLTSSPD